MSAALKAEAPRMESGEAGTGTWPAELHLAFRPDACPPARTLLLNRHVGPLRIQKALYPEDPRVCHAIVVHPPGGIAGGDELSVHVEVAPSAAAVITTPGAAKWYGSAGPHAQQSVDLNINGGLEWLPQESILFNQAKGRSNIQIRLAPESCMIGWDSLILGRSASGEQFLEGEFSQSIRLSFESRLVWEERLHLIGSDPLFNSKIGLCGKIGLTSLWAVLKEDDQWTAEEQNGLRAHCPEIAWTILEPRLIVGRQLGTSLTLHDARLKAWKILRPRVFNRPAIPPRIWST